MTIIRRSASPLALLACIFALGFVSSAQAQQSFYFALNGAQEVPPTGSAAAGTGILVLNAAETSFDITFNFSGLGSAQTAAHIHGATPRGVSGPILLALPNGSPSTLSGNPITPTQVADLKRGLWYVNVHTSGFPTGEIRGQIEKGASSFRATLDGAQEGGGVITTATGNGTVVLNPAETHITYTMSFSGLTSNQTASHIHGPAPRGTSAGVVIGIGSTGTTSGSFTATVPVSTADIANLKNSLFYFNVHSTVYGGGEIRGQIEPDCSPLAGGLVSWYRAEGNAFDQNALNNGTLENGATFTTGMSGRAFSLDGIDDRVLLGNATGMQTQDFTIEGWIKRSSSTIVSNNPFPGFDQGLILAYGSGGYGFAIDRITSKLLLTKVDDSQVVAPTLTITDTNFHHVAITKSGGNVTFFVDGVADTPAVYNPTFTFATNPAIGRRGDANSFNTFFGAIDELSVFSTPLNTSQIASIFNAGAAGKCPPCIATPIGLMEWLTGDGDLLGKRNRFNGVFTGDATFAEGLGGHAMKFGGGGSSVNIVHSPGLNPTNQFTIDAWINPAILHNGVGQGGVISKIGGLGGNNGYQFGIGSNNTQIFCQFNATGEPWPANQVIANVPAGGLPLNTWSHIGCTYNNANLKVYLDGIEIGSLNVGPKTVASTVSDLRISGDSNNNVFFTGMIDEPHVFGRALSATEIASVVNAGRSCFCKPTATAAPANLVGWWGGDGDARDISGNNNMGLAVNGALMAIAKVGQGFALDGSDDFIEILDAPSLEMTNQVTLEAWIRPTDISNFRQIISKFGTVGNYAYQFGLAPSGALRMDVSQTGGPTYAQLSSPPGVITVNTWNHVVAAFNQGSISLYVNGNQVAFGEVPISSVFGNGSTNVNIGRDPVGGQHFAGIIDEAAIYNRALNPVEITSIFNAGIAGKLKQANQIVPLPPKQDPANRPNGVAVSNALVGDATVSLFGVTQGGTTQQIPVDPAKLPPMPVGFISAGLTYDIATTATYNAGARVCFNLPAFTAAQLANTSIWHLENDNWINRTDMASVYPNRCTTNLTSLSPFAIGQFQPNAAPATITGRVSSAQGQGIPRAIVYLTDQNGVTRTARTSAFGYFRFDDIMAGQTYVVVIGHKRFTFAPRVVTVEDEITELDFTALE